MRKTAEAVIIGGGVTGCSALYYLTSLGMRDVALLERDVLASGGSGRSQAILRMHYSNPITAGMAWKSLEVFQRFQEIVGQSAGYVRTGYFAIVKPEDVKPLKQNVAMQQDLGIDTRLVSREEVKDLAPMLEVDDAGAMAYESQSGYADPYLVATGFAHRAREMGAEVYMRVGATSIIATGGKETGVETPQGFISTPRVLVAAGPWTPRLLGPLGLDIPITTTRHQVVMVHRPQGLLPTHPTVGDIAQEFSFRPDAEDLTLIGIGEGEADVDDYEQGVDQATVEEAISKLVRRMPAMAEGYFRGGWSGLFDVTPDWHPVMDKAPGIDGLYVAAGFSGHGFKLSPMVGLSMAEMMTNGLASTFDLRPLRWSRFQEGDLVRSRYRYSVLA
jgi:glycine/D-amino acid oxidase-like deaminating enzyme